CACARFQVNPKILHLHAVRRIFRYLKGQPKLGLWYSKDLPFDLVTYNDSDYSGASLDRKSTTGGCQFLGCKLISWQCKKQTVVANSTTEVEYVAASSCCGQVLWIQNQLLDYGYNFMQTKIHINNESTIYIVKNPVFHSKTKHIEIRHHLIRDSNEKKLIQMVKIHTDKNFANLRTKSFDAKNINEEAQIHAKVDEKKVVISKASIRRDLWFGDEGSIDCLPNEINFEQLSLMGAKTTTWNEFSGTIASAVICLAKFNFLSISLIVWTYVPPSHTKKIFENIKRVGKGFSGRETPLFPTMLVQAQKELGEDIAILTETHPTLTITQSSTSKPQKKQKPRKPKRHDTEEIQPSGPTTNVEDEAFNEKIISQHSNEPFYSGDSSKQGSISDIDANQDIHLVNVHRDEDIFGINDQDDTLMFNADKDLHGEEVVVEKFVVEEVNATSITTSATVAATTAVSFDELTLAQALMDIKTSKPKEKGNVMQEQSEATTTTIITIIPSIKSQDKGKGIMVEPEMPLKKAQISLDEEFAFKLQAEEDEQKRILKEKPQQIEEAKLFMKFLEKRRKFFATKRVKEKRNKPPTKAQQKKIAQESSSKRAGDELEQEIAKKQKTEDKNESAELKRCLELVLDDRDKMTIDATPPSVKNPIVDYKIYKEGRNIFFQIIRANDVSTYKSHTTSNVQQCKASS
nr:putative ribonuclease H-like domain-containing protein [Tanacetum cinerariifolium]